MRRRLGILAVTMASLLAVSACDRSPVGTTSTSPVVEGVETTSGADVDRSSPTPVIVDYSPTVSDVGGLMYLLAHPKAQVIAVSLPVTGEAGCELGFEVTLGILAMFDQEDIPVVCDPDMPPHARQWPSEFLAGHESLSSGLPPSTASPSGESASDLIARTAAEAGQPVVLYAVAPLTNVARALDDHPELADDLEQIVIMGGAVDVPGNVQGTDAEWNLWIDVPAAAAVIGSGVPVTLVPLDATNQVPVPSWYRDALSEASPSDAITYLNRLVDLFPAVTSGFYFMWDELAASVVVGEPLTHTETMTIRVVDGGPDDGRTTMAGDGQAISVAIGVGDPDAFYANFLSTLAGAPVQVGGS